MFMDPSIYGDMLLILLTLQRVIMRCSREISYTYLAYTNNVDLLSCFTTSYVVRQELYWRSKLL